LLYSSFWIVLLPLLLNVTFQLQEKYVDSENSDDDDDDELELSDEDDAFVENQRQPKRLKVGGTKPPKGRKLPIQAQRKRGMSFTDDEDSSGKESNEPSDAEFSHRSKKPDKLHHKIMSRNDSNPSNSHNELELRTSGRRRMVKKISYAESEESDDSEEKLAKQQKVRVPYSIMYILFDMWTQIHVYLSFCP
jgi:chromodomain-helicase-DNA-binding protein 1